MNDKVRYIISSVSAHPDTSESEVLRRVKGRLKSLGVASGGLELSIFKKSVDARRRSDIKLVYSVEVSVDASDRSVCKTLERIGAKRLEDSTLQFCYGDRERTQRPLVVGMGPAGMFCALILAEQGHRPIIIDRGDCVSERAEAVERFYRTGVLDTECNIQFGAGGAGTFSDGKLMTRINDPRCAYVLDVFERFGAPSEIKKLAKPHIGTDVLRGVVDRILSYIESLGGQVIYRCKLTGISESEHGYTCVHTTQGDIACEDVVLALGHSARDTYKMLIGSGYSVEPKPISVGVRIEHRREDIEHMLYGDMAGHKALGAAEYSLSDTRRERGVYTFCMCPGGEVMGAASEEGRVVVNGMSRYARDGINSNSAIAVSLRVSDYEAYDGSLALGAIELQRKIEAAAFEAGGRDYSAPIQTVGDFMSGTHGSEPTRVIPTYMGGKCRCSDMGQVLPSVVTEYLRYGISSFDGKMHGFADPRAILTGAETRTSAPVRILRSENLCAIGHEGIYPCGEGAGYAGGITSAAVDGVRVALEIIKKYKRSDNCTGTDEV